MKGYCRDCLTPFEIAGPQAGRVRCTQCGSPRTTAHEEISQLSIAHVDCDAFFAAVEKHDNPELQDQPVIVGGGQRGVVSTCCYLARTYGVHSAMPMFTARKLCPDAVIIKPRMPRYVDVGRLIRSRMLALTPLVEPVSIDEAFLDLSGTDKLHGACPALTLMSFAKAIEEEVGVSVSVGLSHNKSMAKLASDLDKPRGFSIIGQRESRSFLAPLPVRALFGVGAATAKTFERKGYQTLQDLQDAKPDELVGLVGQQGWRLQALACGIDPRPVRPDRQRKSVSSERTFGSDIADRERLRANTRQACERVAKQLKEKDLSGKTVTLKLKSADFKTRTRSHTLSAPTQSADRMFRTLEPLLDPLANGASYRLLGVGISDLYDANTADDRDLADHNAERRSDAERAMDHLRARYGDEAVNVGLVFEANSASKSKSE